MSINVVASGCDKPVDGPTLDIDPGIESLTTGASGGTSTDGDSSATGSTTGGSTPPADSSDEGVGSWPGDGGGPGSTGTEESDGTGVGETGPPSCSDESIQLLVEVPQVVLLLDKSRSMILNEWDHDDDPVTAAVTRWNSLYSVVDALTHDVEDGIELGMVLFPSPSLTETDSATACLVDADPAAPVALGNADTIVGSMPAADTYELYGGTPASSGMEVVLNHLADVDDGRPQAVILITDGAANCMAGTEGTEVFTAYDYGLEPLVSGALDSGIPTYVVGVDIVDEVGEYPTENPYLRLNELAQAGGVPQVGADDVFYNTTDEDQLLVVLNGIAAELGCTIDLTSAAEFTSQITVRIGGVEVPRVTECSPDSDGWRYMQESAPYESIELCTSTCNTAHAEAALDISYSCVPPM